MDLHSKKLEEIKTKGGDALKPKPVTGTQDLVEISDKIKISKMQTTQFK
jgi:hypothetical protein